MRAILNSPNVNIIQSVDRALSILEGFSIKEKELGVTEISRRTGLNKSTCFGLIQTLQNRGYLEQNPENGKYKLGLKVFELGQVFEAGLELRAIAKPYLQELVNQTKETVHLVLKNKHEAVYVEKVEGPSAISIISQVGNRVNFHCTGVGKAILAFLPEEEVQDVMKKEFISFTKNTITDRKVLQRQLKDIKQSGYSIDDEEIEIGLRCIAAPIFNHRKEVIAALSISGPTMRVTEERIPELAELAKETAAKISARLGCYNLGK